MTKKAIIFNSVMLSAALSLVLAGSEGHPVALVSTGASEHLGQLEQAAARTPSPESVGQLAAAYLDLNQPGLAQSVLDRHATLSGAELEYTRARAAMARGAASESLRLAQLAVLSCDQQDCSATLTGRALQHEAYAAALVEAGVEDPHRDPLAAQAAQYASARKVRLASR